MARISTSSSSYLYMAMKSNGRRSMGLRRARNERALAEQLRRERLVPMKSWELPSWATAPERLSLKDQAEVNTQLAQLLGRGVPLVEAMDVVVSAVSSTVQPVVRRMREMVASGSSFSDACEAVGVFDRVTVAVYRAAERTGDLPGASKQLALTARRQLAVAGKAATLMIYPVIVLTISSIVCVLMLTVIVPRIGKALQSGGFDMPGYSRVMVICGSFVAEHWIWFLAGFAGFVMLAIAGRKQIAAAVATASRRLPLLRDVVLAQESTRFFTVMAALSRSGVPLSDALGVANDAISHPQLRDQLVLLRKRLIEGGALRQLIDTVTALPLPTRRLLIAAERSGDLDSAFELLASDMAEEVERRSHRLLAAMEPMMIVIMFLMIGSMVLAIMIPMIQAAANSVK